jgi:tripartite-type tricarboxylate transporter receptor subunit TctC
VKWLYALFAYFAIAAISSASAQTYPARQITVVVPFAPGGTLDVVARMFVTKMADNTGQQIIVDNRGGGGGTLGIALVAKAAPDGYKILYAPNTAAIIPAFYRQLGFDPVNDLAPISKTISSSLVLVANPQLKVNTLRDFILLAKAQAGKLNFGSAGVADPLQLGVEMLKSETGIQAEAIQYKGQGPMFAALLTGEVDFGVVSLQTALASIENGQLRALGVTGRKRSKALPQVPTVAESGVDGYELESWHGFFAPAGTPSAILERLHREIARAGNSPDVKKFIEDAGNEVVVNSPQEFTAQFRADVKEFKRLREKAHLPYQD